MSIRTFQARHEARYVRGASQQHACQGNGADKVTHRYDAIAGSNGGCCLCVCSGRLHSFTYFRGARANQFRQRDDATDTSGASAALNALVSVGQRQEDTPEGSSAGAPSILSLVGKIKTSLEAALDATSDPHVKAHILESPPLISEPASY